MGFVTLAVVIGMVTYVWSKWKSPAGSKRATSGNHGPLRFTAVDTANDNRRNGGKKFRPLGKPSAPKVDWVTGRRLDS